MSYGYEAAMEAAGAVVHVSQKFGDYQGTTWAKVSYKGQTGWVSYGYGSCSSCDSYQDFASKHGYDEIPQEDLARFGEDYLTDIMSQERAEVAASREEGWDMEAEKVLAFLRENAVA